MSEEDLRECPFCGENMPKRDNNDWNEYIVWCENCGAIGPNHISVDSTDEMWNLRRPYDALRFENAKLRAEIERLRAEIISWESTH